MSVIGIDFGNESCYVAAAKAGGIETLANDYSLRATPSFVAFDGKKRVIGVAAKNQQVTNMKNTVNGFKHLLGRCYNDPHVQNELTTIPIKVESRSDGSIGICVNYLDQKQSFTPEQLTAMLFTKLKETSANALQAQVNDCVIACPVYFTNAERKALLDAAQIAGLNVLRLMNETTATALSYGFYKQDLPDDKPRIVVFVDCGHSTLQVSAAAYTRGKLRMIASTWDQIGGRDFDAVLADHFAKEFYDRYKINAKNNARAYLRLTTEIEKLKKQMSANSTKLPLNIECFMDDIDVSSSMQRSQMEELCAHLFQRVEFTFKKLLHDSRLSLDEIHSVEIVGGSSRIPAIKQLIEQVFGKVASTTLNQDESVSRGAALQCAIMSPAVRVRDFSVSDIQNYAVKVSWDGDSQQPSGDIEVFHAFHAAPFSRLLTLNRKEPFVLTLQYAQPVPYPEPIIGKWFIKDVKPNERGEYQEVKVKVRINHHGIVLISSASLVEKVDQNDPNAANNAAAPTTEPSSDDKSSSGSGGNGDPQQQGNNIEPMDISQEGTDKKKKSTKLIELPMDVKTHSFLNYDLNSLIQQEAKMIANDARETERIDAKNALEEFVYDMRNKLQDGPYERYIHITDRDIICAELNELEGWLYGEGEDCDRETYVNKLKSLQAQTDPVRERVIDYENGPTAFEEVKRAINNIRLSYNEFKKGSPKFEHLTETEFLNLSEAADKAQKWLDQNHAKFTQALRTQDSPIKLSEIRGQYQTLTSLYNTTVNRPKSKPSTASAPTGGPNKGGPTNNKDGGAAGGGQQQQQHEQHNGEQTTTSSNNNNAGGEQQQQRQQNNTNNTGPEDSTMDVE